MAAIDMEQVVPGAVRAWAARDPRRLAVRDGSREVSYGGLIERVDRIADAVMRTLGVAPGERVAVFAPNCLELVELVLGLGAGGVVAVLVDATAAHDELAQICGDSGSRVLFVHPSLLGLAESAELSTVERIVPFGDAYEALLHGARAERPRATPAPSDPFILLYTAGTTGGGKGVLHTHRSKALLFPTARDEYGCFGPDDRTLSVAPLTHGAGFGFGFAPLFTGGSCTVLPLFHAPTVARVLEQHEITNVFLASTHIRALLALDRDFHLPALKTLVSGAAPIAHASKEQFVERFGDSVLNETYGTTEAGMVARLGSADQLRKPESIGRPLARVRLSVLDEAGRPVAPGETGELHIASPYLFDGYWRRPDETAAVFLDGAYRSGDVARVDDEGYYFLVDRMHDKIVSGGLNLYPREVEEVLARHPAVAEVVVFGVPDERLGEVVRAAVTVREGRAVDVGELLDLCARSLSGYKRPREIDVVDSLPKNAAGKILRRAVRDPYWSGRGRNIA